MRNAGNIVPPFGTGGSGEAATIEFAVAGLGVEDVIVCGHSLCGAMKGLLSPAETERLPAVRQWLTYAEATRRIVCENYTHLEGRALLTATVEENVLVQLENLRTHPSVAAAVGRHALRLHGWVYKLETGEVFAYSPDQGQFLPLSALYDAAKEMPRTATVAQTSI
jgi:carbonic anhydrase